MNPLSAVVEAVTFLFHPLFVVGLCALVDWFTSPGEQWAGWVAFWMGIALRCVSAKALRVVATTVGLAGGAWLVHRRWTGRSSKSDSTVRALDPRGYRGFAAAAFGGASTTCTKSSPSFSMPSS